MLCNVVFVDVVDDEVAECRDCTLVVRPCVDTLVMVTC